MAKINWLDILGWNSNKIEGLRMTAVAYMSQGHYEIAQTYLEAIVILDPGNIFDLKALGAISLQTNDPIKALAYLEEVLQIEPHDELSLINRVKALFMLGYREEGLRLARSLLTIGKNKEIGNDAEALVLAYG